MQIEKQEKQLIKYLLDKHLEEVRKNEVLADTSVKMFAAEVKYEQFVKNLVKKIK